jgi:hypothetical protein
MKNKAFWVPLRLRAFMMKLLVFFIGLRLYLVNVYFSCREIPGSRISDIGR